VLMESSKTVKMLMNLPGSSNMEYLECILRCRQAMIHPQIYLDSMAVKKEEDPTEWEGESTKMNTLRDMITKHPKEKSIVFCQFVQEMDIVQEVLEDKEIKIYRIDGSVTGQKRVDEINRFKQGEPNAVFLIQIKAGGVGLNLQEASRIYITSPSWNPATELQAIGRAYRTGQTKKVIVRKLVYGGMEGFPSIEQSIVKLQNTKHEYYTEVINDKDVIPKNSVKVTELKSIFI
jgi:SNF2 family DNA or RNA helicase